MLSQIYFTDFKYCLYTRKIILSATGTLHIYPCDIIDTEYIIRKIQAVIFNIWHVRIATVAKTWQQPRLPAMKKASLQEGVVREEQS